MLLVVARQLPVICSSPATRRYRSPLHRWPYCALLLCCALLLGAAGCSRGAASAGENSASAKAARARAAVQARKAAQAKEEEAREELEQIPPPSKNSYLPVHTRDAYANPFVIVHPETVSLMVMLPDLNPHGFGTGGMLRPKAARRKQFELQPPGLPDALSSLPPELWPYGRVVAVEEQPAATPEARVEIRRNEEATIRVLNNLGVVVDEWSGAKGSLLR